MCPCSSPAASGVQSLQLVLLVPTPLKRFVSRGRIFRHAGPRVDRAAKQILHVERSQSFRGVFGGGQLDKAVPRVPRADRVYRQVDFLR